MQAQPDHGDPQEAELVRRARAGDADAFAALVRRCQDRMFTTLARMCGNEADALDLLQRALLRAWQGLDRFEGRAEFRTWLYRIAVNLLLSDRRRRRPAMHSLEARDTRDARDVPDERTLLRPVARLETRELRGRIEAALARLPEEFRVPVLLRDLEGFDYAQIAAVLGAPVGTVKSRVHRGRLLLRHWLADEESARE